MKTRNSGITGGFDYDEMEDGSCIISKDGVIVSTQPSLAAMRQWVMDERRKSRTQKVSE
jgi:hypothetical protein